MKILMFTSKNNQLPQRNHKKAYESNLDHKEKRKTQQPGVGGASKVNEKSVIKWRFWEKIQIS